MSGWFWGVFILAAYGTGLRTGAMDERWRHRVMHKYMAGARGHTTPRSRYTVIGRLTATVGAVDGRIDPADVDGPFSYRHKSGAMSCAAVAMFRVPAGFKVPAGRGLFRNQGHHKGAGYESWLT